MKTIKQISLTAILLIVITISNAQTWHVFGGDSIHNGGGCPPSCPWATDFYVDGDTLYMTGAFIWADTLELWGIGKWYDNTWHSLVTGPTDDALSCVEKYKGKIYTGGDMLDGGGVGIQYLAVWDGNNWSGIPGLTANEVHDFATFHDTLFIAYGFGDYKGIIAYDGVNLIDVGDMNTNWTKALAVYNNQLYAGGYFVGLRKRTGATTWEQAHGNIDNWVNDLEVDTFNNFLYVGGAFLIVGDTVTSYTVAMWDGYNWNSMGQEVNCDIYPKAMAVYRGDLYVGGCFDTLESGLVANYIARWDGTQWHNLGSGCSSVVWTLTVFKDTLIVGGTFHYVDDSIKTYALAKWYMPDTSCNYIKPILYALENNVVKDTFYILNDTAQVQFYNNNAYADSWSWDFGDSGTANIKDPLHKYTIPGTYNVQVAVKHGTCIKTASKEITVRFPVGKEEINKEEPQFKIYPNPSDGNFYVEINKQADTPLHGYVLKITDLKGKLISTIPVKSNKTTIKTEGWNKGIYICNLLIEGKIIKSEKIVFE